jgi:hypothetical protein
MASKFEFISGLDTEEAYQLFEADIGLEKANVLVPLSNADSFLTEARSAKPKSIASLHKLAQQYGGYVDGF